jgi:hypothetical protein
MPDSDYEAVLDKGRASTLSHPPGQLQGRAGRRCALEDGERYLERCVAARPADLRAHVLLMRNLMRQATGREREVPGLALAALRNAVDAEGTSSDGGAGRHQPAAPSSAWPRRGGEGEQGGGRYGGEEGAHAGGGGGLEACSSELLDPACVPALQAVLLALKALHAQQPPADVLAAAAREPKGGDGSGSPAGTGPRPASAVASWRARRLLAFVEAAGDVVPGLAREFANVERRLGRQLVDGGPGGGDGGGGGGGDSARQRALASREWLSAVDLAPPCGVVG